MCPVKPTNSHTITLCLGHTNSSACATCIVETEWTTNPMLTGESVILSSETQSVCWRGHHWHRFSVGIRAQRRTSCSTAHKRSYIYIYIYISISIYIVSPMVPPRLFLCRGLWQQRFSRCFSDPWSCRDLWSCWGFWPQFSLWVSHSSSPVLEQCELENQE